MYNIVIYNTLVLTLFTAGCRDNNSDKADEKVLYTALAAKVRALDPGDIGDTTSSSVASQIFECLYQYHYLKRPYELIPLLAAEMPVVSEDGLTYTIELKKGVYFSDDECFGQGKGRELTADDFIYSWMRIADIKYLSKNWWIFDGRIEGLDEFREYTKACKSASDVDYSRPVSGLQALDKYTLQIRLRAPWPQIIYMLAHLPTAPVAREAVEYYRRDIINNPVGTGPYKLRSWHRGSYIELVRNPSFRAEPYPCQGEETDPQHGFLADCGKTLPLVDRILMVLVQEDPPRWFLFLQGKLDASGIPKDSFNKAIDQSGGLTGTMEKRGIHLEKFREPSTYWIGFNMEDDLLGSNRPLRQAISSAIDRNKYIELFTNNRAESAGGFIPPLMKAYSSKTAERAYLYNPVRAKKLVKEAEKLHGSQLPVLTLSIAGTDVVARQQGAFYSKCFSDAGLEIEIDYLDWPTFQNAVKTRSAQMFSLGWIADYPDAENFLQLFYSKNASPGPNNFNYSNPEFDRLYETVSVMSDSPERTRLYREAEKLVVEDCPAAFIVHGVAYVLYHDWVENYKPHSFGYGLSKYRNIDQTKKQQYKQLLKNIK